LGDIDPCRFQSRAADIGANSSSVREFIQERHKQSSRAGTDVENAQLFHAQTAAHDKIQRTFDHGFSLRSWHQNVRRYRKRKTPEFFSSKNARYRLAFQSARGESGYGIDFASFQNAIRLTDQPGTIEMQRVTGEDTGVDIGILDAGSTERLGNEL
jgi:hypothetical protein